MKTNYTKIKTIIQVMGKYGVKPLSKMKGADFVHDLGFDAVYVGGLIYDVEDALHVRLDDDEAKNLRNPQELIGSMLRYQN
ncbi:hypothetical protein QWY93_08560 [Echinicola jeungdonensis]|uniref:Acyl carrier protein n=1 Tax=Echinicola jeungdonensis TaxID=709343 RepID=A0ABV5J495_9BACT|nr:hypothetical protein [Echinicola jeungdonensis]MDN3669379.1 hypothetical protein [Echinicola jeungdonensis]